MYGQNVEAVWFTGVVTEVDQNLDGARQNHLKKFCVCRCKFSLADVR